MKELTFDILVTASNGYWGIDSTIEDAKTRCKRGGGKAPYIVSIMPKDSDIHAHEAGQDLTFHRGVNRGDSLHPLKFACATER